MNYSRWSSYLLLSALVGCSSSSDTPNDTNSSALSQTSSMPSGQSQISSSQTTGDSLSQQSSSSSAVGTSSQPSSDSATYIDVSSQFGADFADRYHLLQASSDTTSLYYLPKQLWLDGAPGVASLQYTNKVSPLAASFLELSVTDWSSSPQSTLASRYAVKSSSVHLQSASNDAGFVQLKDLPVKPPVVWLARKFIASPNISRDEISCDTLTLMIDDMPQSLLDCYVEQAGQRKTINTTNSFFIESDNFNPDTISSNASIKGLFNLDFTLPGSIAVENSLRDSQSLSNLLQINFAWPLLENVVYSVTVLPDWAIIHQELLQEVNSGRTSWSPQELRDWVSQLVNNDILSVSDTINAYDDFISQLVRHFAQELLVGVYIEPHGDPVLWVPRLQPENIDSQTGSMWSIRYFTNETLYSQLTFECLSTPDAQNNIHYLEDCDS